MDYDILLFSTHYFLALIYAFIGSGIWVIALSWKEPFRPGLRKYLITAGTAVFIGACILFVCSFAAVSIAAPASWLARLPPAEKTRIRDVLSSSSHRHPTLSIQEFNEINEAYVHRDELAEEARARRCASLKNYYLQSIAVGAAPAVPRYCLKLFASQT